MKFQERKYNEIVRGWLRRDIVPCGVVGEMTRPVWAYAQIVSLGTGWELGKAGVALLSRRELCLAQMRGGW